MDTISSHQISPGSASPAWLLCQQKHQGQGTIPCPIWMSLSTPCRGILTNCSLSRWVFPTFFIYFTQILKYSNTQILITRERQSYLNGIPEDSRMDKEKFPKSRCSPKRTGDFPLSYFVIIWYLSENRVKKCKMLIIYIFSGMFCL